MEGHLSPLSQPPPTRFPMRSIVTTDLRPMYFQWIFSTFNFTVVVSQSGLLRRGKMKREERDLCRLPTSYLMKQPIKFLVETYLFSKPVSFNV